MELSHPGLVVLVDFDGTVVHIDTAAFVLERFARGEWKAFDEQLERGVITLEECMRNQFLLVKASEMEILRELDQVVALRPNFEKLVASCNRQRIPIAIVSAGLDFCLRHILSQNGLTKGIEFVTPRAQCAPNGMKFTSFPKLRYPESHNFKDDLVKYYKQRGSRVVFVGDALIDYYAARNADTAFAVHGSELAEACERDGVPYVGLTDFSDVVRNLDSVE